MARYQRRSTISTSLLSQFQDANKAVISGNPFGHATSSDALDQRDALLKKIADYVPVSTFTRGDNDMVITTKDGTTLFETIPRSVSFTPSAGYTAGTPGNTIYIDNVPVSAGTGGNTSADGKLAGLITLARRRRRDHAEPARRGRARAHHRLCRDSALRSPTEPACSPGPARPPFRPPAR